MDQLLPGSQIFEEHSAIIKDLGGPSTSPFSGLPIWAPRGIQFENQKLPGGHFRYDSQIVHIPTVPVAWVLRYAVKINIDKHAQSWDLRVDFFKIVVFMKTRFFLAQICDFQKCENVVISLFSVDFQ